MLFWAGCDSEDLQDADTPSGDRVQFVMGGLDEAPDSSDPVELRSASFDGSVLKVDVSYSGGCEEHAFTLYSADQMIAIYPPLVYVAIVHDARGDRCEAYISETIDVDMSTLIESLNSSFGMDLGVQGTSSVLRIQYTGS
jgi:hypothetical protein